MSAPTIPWTTAARAAIACAGEAEVDQALAHTVRRFADRLPPTPTWAMAWETIGRFLDAAGVDRDRFRVAVRELNRRELDAIAEADAMVDRLRSSVVLPEPRRAPSRGRHDAESWPSPTANMTLALEPIDPVWDWCRMAALALDKGGELA